MYQTAVITVSDSGAAGCREDKSGHMIMEMLPKEQYEIAGYTIVPDETEKLKEVLLQFCDEKHCHLIITTGGTGLSKRDITPEATKLIATKEVPGIAEAIRNYSIGKTKRAMLSRGVSVIRNETLIINLPGSPKAIAEILEYLLDVLPHGLDILSGDARECAR